jgi:predicted Zn-dependent peptidase
MIRRSRRPRSHTAALAAPPALRTLPGRLRVERLENGLTVCLFANGQAPVVTSALFYRVGTSWST